MSTAERAALAVTKLVETYNSEFEKVLPRHMRLDHFMRCAVTYIKKNPAVGECTTESIMKSLMDAAQLGLAPDGLLGSAYLVPFNNKIKGRNGEQDRWEKTCQLIPGYRGMIDLARRSGLILNIVARPVLRTDEFTIDWGRPHPIAHLPNLDGDPDSHPEDVRGVYALATLKDGTLQCEYMSRAQIDRIKNRSQAAKKGFSPWQSDWTEMARKTVVKRLCKYLPLSPELARLIQYDNDAEVVLDAHVTQAEAPPPASKADALAKQLGHEPRADLNAEIGRAQAEREAEIGAEVTSGGVDEAGGTVPPERVETTESAPPPARDSAGPSLLEVFNILRGEANVSFERCCEALQTDEPELVARLEAGAPFSLGELNTLEGLGMVIKDLKSKGKSRRKVEA